MSAKRVGLYLGRRALLRAVVSADGALVFEDLSMPPQGAPAASPLGAQVSVSLSPGISIARSSTGELSTRPAALSTTEDLEALEAYLRPLIGDGPLRTLSSPAEALREVFGECAFSVAGERFEVWRDEAGSILRCRSYPVDGPDDPGSLTWEGKSIPLRYAPALAAAVCDPDRVPNRATLLPGSKGALLARLREPILNVAAAAALILGALGVWLHREKSREEADLATTKRATMELWSRVLPSEAPKESGLLRALHARLGDGGGEAGPSMLAFWTEIGKHMPDPEPLGLCLESLDLSPEGGRLSARLPAGKDDPLKNAAALEGHLNQSEKLRSRGDYEVRDGQVQVRLRMEFKP